MKRTKWDILVERRQAAREEFHKLEAQLRGYEHTLFKDGDSSCASCGAPTPTEAAFAKHYLIDDERYLNLGNCPTRYNDGTLMPPLFSSWGGKHLYEEAYEVNERWWEAMLEDAYMTNEERGGVPLNEI